MIRSLLKQLLLCLPLLLFGCNQPNPLKEYIANIPDEEEINASIYHYELIVKEVRQAHSNQEYYRVFELYEKYLSVFFEAAVPDEEELLYWVGMSVRDVVAQGNDPSVSKGKIFFNYLKEDKKRKNHLGVEFVGDYASNRNGETLPQELKYTWKHFLSILDRRNDYEWEKRAMVEVYTQKFLPPGEESLNKNMEYVYWLVTRYPDLFPSDGYRSRFRGYVDTGKLGKKRREQWDRVERILSISAWRENSPRENSLCFPVSYPVVVYNRTHAISSRNLISLSLWEPFRVEAQGQGEDDQNWYAVTFGDERRGFIDSETFAGACTLGESWEMSSLEKDLWMGKYYEAYRLYLSQDYVKAVDIMSELLFSMEQDGKIGDDLMFLQVRSLTFFYRILKEIAARSTSVNNPFTRFAMEHPDYFVISKDRVNLEISDYFLKKVITYDRNSPMLQYFDGFN